MQPIISRAVCRSAAGAKPLLSLRSATRCATAVLRSSSRVPTPNGRAYSIATVATSRRLRRAVTSELHFSNARRGYASDSYPPHTILNMPALSPTMTAGNLGQWHKKIGDEIQPGDVLVEVETDKATMDFECQDEGFLAKIFIDAGTKDVDVNKPIAILVENKDDVGKFTEYKLEESSDAPGEPKKVESPPKKEAKDEQKEVKRETKEESAPATAPSSKPASSGDRIFASPLAKQLAAEKGIDLGSIQGTGPNGRIVKDDVLNFKPSAATKPGAASPTSAPAAPAPGASYVDIPLSNVRKVIASRLQESKQQIPHYYLTQEINVDKILRLRELLNSQANGKYKLSVNDFVIKASALALKAVPEVNSSWQGTSIRQFTNADIAVAVATETGLITPIVHRAEGVGLSHISAKVKALAEKARANKLQPNEYQGGTFTISNLGMYGISHFTAIINPPHAAILAVGGAQDKLVLDDTTEKGFRTSKVMNVTLSCDHRVVDGAVGAKWLGVFKSYLENPLTMLL
ncbi:2-oxoacid dehydrogenases acyltransferase-domain-containing protein [Fimicolochytrium jonesii]|uniref:2-oxoacid dehydrogenases acyltransferase-domain-containing protein n=1 Tax=Fimicolochytrium jonesii TaxID=1396493 RepID=UPI0022FEF211|nr:2-oxoacid dehydrogenases acyltransferase-domain-containing protein [Fimicolochytrium jonesii]KAI8818358.1 2-oxoacid dehydrogenases acyltransferase-domain-containing protein [Fimicolochytrium jonesii]